MGGLGGLGGGIVVFIPTAFLLLIGSRKIFKTRVGFGYALILVGFIWSSIHDLITDFFGYILTYVLPNQYQYFSGFIQTSLAVIEFSAFFIIWLYAFLKFRKNETLTPRP